jgi:transcriptional regulator with XRE-family HTH domain
VIPGMNVDKDLIKYLREERAWSQEHLAAVTGLSARTIQRLEADGKASHESRLALAAAFGVEPVELNAVGHATDTGQPEQARQEGGSTVLVQHQHSLSPEVMKAVLVVCALAAVYVLYDFGQVFGKALYYATH